MREEFSAGIELPREWTARVIRNGLTELAIEDSRRLGCITLLGALAAACGGEAIHEWVGDGGAPALWLGVTALLAMLALWMMLARETWLISADLLEHRVGVGSLARVTYLRGARLWIRSGTSRMNRPYHALQATTAQGTHRLIMRGYYDEVAPLGRFIADRAGWPFEG